jgi:hypothetical protein
MPPLTGDDHIDVPRPARTVDKAAARPVRRSWASSADELPTLNKTVGETWLAGANCYPHFGNIPVGNRHCFSHTTANESQCTRPNGQKQIRVAASCFNGIMRERVRSSA